MRGLNLAWTSLICVFVFALPFEGAPSEAQARGASGSDHSRITLDVVVNDKSGTPVAGLQQQDFTLLDNKQPQRITSFDAVSQAASAEGGSEIVLIVDSVNTSFSRVAYEREQLVKFLRQDGGRLSVPVSIGLLSDEGLDMQQTSSRDGNALVAYLDQRQTALRAIRRSQGFYGAADRTQLSLRGLAGLAEFESRRPGRKIVIWISPGWPLLSGPNVILSSKDQQSLFDSIVSTSTRLREARITLYSVDPLGTDDSGGFRTFYYQEFLKPVSQPRQVQYGDLALQVLAHQTGGRVLNSNNDVAGQIARSVRDANAGYILSFDAHPGDGPNEYHAIEVKISKPELKPQTRSGYYAQPTQTRAR